MTNVPGHVMSDSYGVGSAQSHSRIDIDQMLSPSQSVRRPSSMQRYDPCRRTGHLVIPQAP